jgi:NhaP-type Na+/H+ or K+/H+ antiporter
VDPVGLFALGAAVLMTSALLAGVVERAPVSFPMVFLTLGLALGGGTSAAVSIDLHDDVLKTIAFATLALVLFLDALNLDLRHLRGHWVLPALTLGPGTAAVVVLVALAAIAILGLDPLPAFLVGAVLASTDPVVLRDVTHDERIPGGVRRALSLEAGMNDAIVLPTVLVLTAVAGSGISGTGDWVRYVVELLVVGPLAGAVVGVAGAALMSEVDRRRPVRSEWQALYGIGLVLCAFAAGETFGEDGFLAAFAAGAAVALSSRTLCDCFLDFGEVIAELLMLVSFVLFGIVLSTELDAVPLWEGLALAAVALLLVRPLSMWSVLSLRHSVLSRDGRAFIAWFGPRGLNSLLLALLVVEEGVADSREVFALVGLVVLVSVYVHGASATPLAAWYGRRVDRSMHPEERESLADGVLARVSVGDAPRIDAAELRALLDGDAPPVVVDVRSRSGYARDPVRIPGAQRVRPDEVSDWARQQELDRLVVLYCT